MLPSRHSCTHLCCLQSAKLRRRDPVIKKFQQNNRDHPELSKLTAKDIASIVQTDAQSEHCSSSGEPDEEASADIEKKKIIKAGLDPEAPKWWIRKNRVLELRCPEWCSTFMSTSVKYTRKRCSPLSV